ncbi:hypothetical protein HXX76_004336 [Chlamydomonas incerta]|uniref:J domain-containing protein n=1 Tax=Chlamydomonas incerta TaxID=51695 RepID=A0A835TH44_CHLIN|nr:hypothetical protein HXX76_004336 [Chlamydomonas incerta]|eukprot:KAG2440224.1 hypothetical protein HXX76_004336 [Chlamydomonas incerta]
MMRSLVAQRVSVSTVRHGARGRASCVVTRCSAHRCHYRVLGVNPAASGDEIKSAFRKLAKEKHPDVAGHTPAANEEFKAVKAAWDVLGNTESKAQYDGELRAAAKTAAAAAAASRGAHQRQSARSSPANWGVPSKPPPPVPAGARHMRTEHEAAGGPQFVSFVGVTQPQPPRAAGHAAQSSSGAATTAAASSAPTGASPAAPSASARGSHSPPGSAGAWWAHWPPQQPNSQQQQQQQHSDAQQTAAVTPHVVRSRQAAAKSRRVVRSFHPVDDGPAHPMPAGAPRMRMDTEDESFVSFLGVHTHSHQPEQEWQPGHRDHVAQLAQQLRRQQHPQQQQQQHGPHHAQHRPHQQHHQH